ncbi:MAG: O-antigen ligase family protein [Acidobacteria bacterium]|nr:O-antigen ligase family protein [Acidobacteriota bacterium]
MGILVYAMLQRRRILSMVVIGVAAALILTFAPIQSTYFNRLETIGTHDEVRDDSASGRLHFWRVALVIARDHPFGIGLRNFEHAYDQYDFSGGFYGPKRSVHNSHLQALVEAGYAGAAIWAFLFGYSLWTMLKVRRRAKDPTLDPESRRFYFTTANALIASMSAFLVGGTFGAEVLSDLNWFTFGLVAALGRLAAQPVAVDDAASEQRSPAGSGWTNKGAPAPAFANSGPAALKAVSRTSSVGRGR